MRRHLFAHFRPRSVEIFLFSDEKAHLSNPLLFVKSSSVFSFEQAKFQTVFFNSNRYWPVRSPWILWWSLLMLWPIAIRILCASTFFFPRYRYLRNAISCFISAKDPSACMLRFTRNCVPRSLRIRPRSSFLFSCMSSSKLPFEW